jgi:hypothetical protein
MAEHRILPAKDVKSLAWSGDELVDMAGGWRTFRLNGSIAGPYWGSHFRFDAAAFSHDRKYSILYERLGTKGVVSGDREMLREVNRSFYYANLFEYPVCFWSDHTGRIFLVHCPEEYNRLEIEDAETGERLTECGTREPSDFFHSRLEISPNGKWLASAGWIWHPLDAVRVFDVAGSIADASRLDDPDESEIRLDDSYTEQCSAACWQSGDILQLAVHDDEGMAAHRLVTYSAASREVVGTVAVDAPLGNLMAVGAGHAVAFHGHPRLIDVADGRVVEEWSELSCGRQIGSIHVPGAESPPPMAFDPANRRFALVQDDGIHVIEL